MRVMLINPPSAHEMKGPHPFKAEDMGVFPHLGLMYIAAVLKQDSCFEVMLVDMAMEKLAPAQLAALYEEFRPQVTGITSYTDCLYDLKLVIDILKRSAHGSVLCVGGPHVEVYPEETLETFPVDCIIRGDGEYSFRELCRRVRDGVSWHDVGGVGYREGAITRLNNVWQVEDLDSLPFPSRSLSSMQKVSSAVVGDLAVTSICSSRGCPFPCTFCNSPYKTYRLRSPANVVAEMAECHSLYGIDTFFFFDDLFNLSRQRLMDMCNAIMTLPFRVMWSFRGRINAVDAEVLRTCKKAGCNRIHFGVESGSERVLESYKKGVTLAQVKEAFSLCRKLDIETVGNFMFGAPGEASEDMAETVRFAYALEPTYLEFHVLVPYPYTEIYRDMLRSGVIKQDVWRDYALNPCPGFTPPLCEDLVSAGEMFALLNRSYRGFYLRPTYIARHFLQINSWRDLVLKVKGGYRMITVTRGE